MLVFTSFCFSIGSKTRKTGFSLLELMVALAIISILSAIATPSLSAWADSSRAKAVRQQLYGLMTEARNHALKQSQTVTICYLEGSKCSKELDFPISMFTDDNRNAKFDEGEQLLRVSSFDLPENIQLKWNRAAGYLRFWPSGGTGALTGSLSYCHQWNPDYDFRLVVARTGRVRFDQDETRCG